ncbi:MAG: hypothetical protein ACXABY_01125 [Candidatus Thorarchaeota archaeon]|jgi:hypothetical protein
MNEIRLTDAEYEALTPEEQEHYDDWVSEAPLRDVESGAALERANDYWAWQVAQREPPDPMMGSWGDEMEQAAVEYQRQQDHKYTLEILPEREK